MLNIFTVMWQILMLYFLYRENHFLFSNDLGVKYALEIHVSYGVVFLLTRFLYVLQSCMFQCLCISALFSRPNELLFIFISQNNAFVKKKKTRNNPNAQYEVCNNVTCEQFSCSWCVQYLMKEPQKGVLYDECSCDVCTDQLSEWDAPFFCPNEGNSKEIRVWVFILKNC